MTKESIFDDAITYIKKLKDEVKSLRQELQAMEAKEKFEERAEPKIDDFSAAKEMKKWRIQVLYK